MGVSDFVLSEIASENVRQQPGIRLWMSIAECGETTT
jgi:hypothetical protein